MEYKKGYKTMITKLKYIGTGQYIVMIPMRDLTDYDLEVITLRTGQGVETIIDELTGEPTSLYVRSDEFYCQQCDKKFKSWMALNKHELKHIEKLAKAVEDSNDGHSINSTKETDTDR